MKGIVLAGGTGSRLMPMTRVLSKQLLPVYDKPMIYYPISTLMLAGIRDILIITTRQDSKSFVELLGDGSNFGVSFTYAIQDEPRGLAQALIIGERFLQGNPCLMILGDNIFHGAGLGGELRKIFPINGAHIFTYAVSDPSQYGILSLDSSGNIGSIVEKPAQSKSNLAITGLYFFDKQASEIAKQVVPSSRGELEITSVLEKYLDQRNLSFTALSRGTAWLDTGNPNAMNDAANYIRVIEERTGLKVACLEEISFANGWISESQLDKLASSNTTNEYGRYLLSLLPKLQN